MNCLKVCVYVYLCIVCKKLFLFIILHKIEEEDYDIIRIVCEELELCVNVL